MAQTLNVYLINKSTDLGGLFKDDSRKQTATLLTGYFSDTIKGSTKYNAVNVVWGGTQSQPVLGDFVCYVLTTSSDSIVAKHMVDDGALGASGTTMMDPVSRGVICEIYMQAIVQGGDPMSLATADKEKAVAGIIFHELGHNLLDATTPNVQSVHGMKNDKGLLRDTDKSPLQPSETPNDIDNKAFQTGYTRRGAGVKQYVDDMPT